MKIEVKLDSLEQRFQERVKNLEACMQLSISVDERTENFIQTIE